MKRLAAAALFMVLATYARAEVRVGVIASVTGPAAALGGPQQNVMALLPKTMAGQAVSYFFLDDASDPTVAAKAAKKLITEDRVDVVLGPSITPTQSQLWGPSPKQKPR